MNRRFLGNSLLIIFIILLISGALLYLKPFEKKVASIHVLFAFLFMGAIFFHVLNNKFPLLNYIRGKGNKKWAKYQSTFIGLALFTICLGVYLDFPGFNYPYEWGNQYRNQQLGKSEEEYNYQIIKLDKKIGEHNISIELKKGEAFQFPILAVWLEDSIGNYVESLYVSQMLSSSVFWQKIDNKWQKTIVRRPEALPYWAHKRGVKASDGLYIPLKSAPDLDGVSGATPTDNFILKTKSDLNTLKKFRILMEVNQSYDWNEYYSKERFPNDSIYSGSGKVGQPALIYAAEIEKTALEAKSNFLLELIGHSHHSGKNGELNSNLENITTAKRIADRIIVSFD
ncbi:DUF4405 domain-containing protein [Xanthovirga aplysinae]|uniref:DUF4405 domain-containing protein n=1 Tax=Xanthovirga aplysinae TaxID=2529853 RepID=UPI0012BD3615|nr:DUF4405 domain-containing protein [Xanthovirga aplysinae]MTI30245.1 DUF4405 domain-containing protein [Xanthovirga aplysinae]